MAGRQLSERTDARGNSPFGHTPKRASLCAVPVPRAQFNEAMRGLARITSRGDAMITVRNRLAHLPSKLVLTVLVLAGLGGCRPGAEPQSHAEHADEKAVTGGSIPSCTPGREPDLALKERKVRVARGVYRASRAHPEWRAIWSCGTRRSGPYWVVAKNFNTMSEVFGEQAIGIYGDEVTRRARGRRGAGRRRAFRRVHADRARSRSEAGGRDRNRAGKRCRCLRWDFAPEIAAGRVIVYEKGVWDKDDTMVLERKNRTGRTRWLPAVPGPTVSARASTES